jgi:16S rRNA (cytosine967-C5)-methyltransferase
MRVVRVVNFIGKPVFEHESGPFWLKMADRTLLTSAPVPSARGVAIDLLGAVLRRRRPLDDAIDEAPDLPSLSVRDRAFARLLVATVLRRLGQIDALIAHCLATPLPPRAGQVHDMLRLGIAQLLFLRTPAHAAVATTVDLADARGFTTHKGLVNAVLRRLSTDGPALVERQDAPKLNTPKWLWNAWSQAYGEAGVRRIAEMHLREAPLDITVKFDETGWGERLDAMVLPTGSLRRAAGGAIANLPGYAEGVWWVQDAAAAIPARLFGDVTSRTMIDLCAAPGGKTAQLAAAGAKLTALDRSPRRLERMINNLGRLSLQVETVSADAVTWKPPRKAWGVLLDAPCTATGAIRRHPDVPHLKTPDDVTRLAAVQERLLHAAIDMLEPGGTLVYCTCSLEPEEGPQQIAKLFARGAPIERKPVQPDEVGGITEFITADGDLRTLPSHLAEYDGIDGFYAARLTRK